MNDTNTAPGAPGIRPTWSSSAKDLVSTALGTSRLWVTFGYGIVNEIYWPSTGHPQIRDLGFIIAGPNGWTEIKRAQNYSISTPKPYIPLPKMIHEGDGYRLELEFLTHPLRDALLIRYKLVGKDLRLYPLLAPHLDGAPTNNVWAGDDFTAQRDGIALCLRSDNGFERTSAGYVGTSDGWQDFAENGKMTWTYSEAPAGNGALIGELPKSSGTLALGFAISPEGARTLARASLADDYDQVRALFVDQWEQWGKTLKIPDLSPVLRREAERSAAVIKIHEDITYAGAIVASLSVPWGSSHDDPGGYHLVWTRDTVEAAIAMIAVGQTADAARTLAYLVGTQATDGSWAQNYYPDGRGYWSGNQLDEVALPIILMAKLRAVGALTPSDGLDEMIEKATGFIVRHGPMSDQDRWEENPGASPFTIAAAICALIAASQSFKAGERDYLLSLADCWNERIEQWLYVDKGAFSLANESSGYYVRLGPVLRDDGAIAMINVKNTGSGPVAADRLIGMEFLTLVRAGLRQVDDPRITSTIELVDKMLRVETPSGPAYHRYNGDGYGEHKDGSPFDGTGVGRLWPLLTGERGHYALAAGTDPAPYLEAMVKMSGPGGMIPEQVWDEAPIENLGLRPGKPSGSAMPLVWAHAEYLKLLAAKADGRPVEQLDEVVNRYGAKIPKAGQWHWRQSSRFSEMPAGRALLIEYSEPFRLRFSLDGWQKISEIDSRPGHFGLHHVRFAPAALKGAPAIDFATFLAEEKRWLDDNGRVRFKD